MGTRRERERVRRPARHDDVTLAGSKVELGEEGPVAELGHEHAHDLGAKGLDELPHEIVAHWARGLDSLQGKGDGGGLWSAYEDRQRKTGAFGLLEQHDRGARPQVDTDSPQMHLDHDSNLPLREPFEHRSRISTEIGFVGDFQPSQVPVALVEIEAVADYVLVTDDLAHIANLDRQQPTALPVEQGTRGRGASATQGDQAEHI